MISTAFDKGTVAHARWWEVLLCCNMVMNAMMVSDVLFTVQFSGSTFVTNQKNRDPCPLYKVFPSFPNAQVLTPKAFLFF